MIEKFIQGWNRYGIVGSQIALIAVLFLYGFSSLRAPWVFSFGVTILLATAHHQWVQSAMFPLIDQATNRGNFSVLARLAWLHQDFVVIGSALLIGVLWLVLWWIQDMDSFLLGSIIIALAGANASWKATLRFHATAMIIQAVALRRLVLIVGGIVGLFFVGEAWFATFAFGLVITAASLSAIRYLIGHIERYKEHRYRRTYEDSGVKESYLSLTGRYVKSYASTFPSLVLPLLIVLSLVVVYRLIESSVSVLEGPMMLLVFGLLLLTNHQVASLRPANDNWRNAYDAQNVSLLRDELALLMERLLFRSSLIAALVVAVVIGGGWIADVWVLGVVFLGLLAVLMTVQVYLLERQVAYLCRPLSSGWMHLFAGVIFLSNGLLLSVYYPEGALLISLGLLLVWWHVATLIEWTQSIGFEWRIHLRQSSKILSAFGLALVANGLILYVLQQVPLGVIPVVEGLVLAALFVMVSSVIVYSMSAILGLRSMIRSRKAFFQETKESLLRHEEEVSLW